MNKRSSGCGIEVTCGRRITASLLLRSMTARVGARRGQISSFERSDQRIHGVKDADRSLERSSRNRGRAEIATLLLKHLPYPAGAPRWARSRRTKRIDVRPNKIRKGTAVFQLSLVVRQRPRTGRGRLAGAIQKREKTTEIVEDFVGEREEVLKLIGRLPRGQPLHHFGSTASTPRSRSHGMAVVVGSGARPKSRLKVRSQRWFEQLYLKSVGERRPVRYCSHPGPSRFGHHRAAVRTTFLVSQYPGSGPIRCHLAGTDGVAVRNSRSSV